MWKKKSNDDLNNYSTNELLTELFLRGDMPIHALNKEDELKIDVFKTFWKHLSAMEISNALGRQLTKRIEKPSVALSVVNHKTSFN